MDILQNAHRLPVLDWNLTFFGGHEQTVNDGWSVPLNKHQAFELIYVLHGQEKIEIANETLMLKSDDFVLIPPGFDHICTAIQNLKYFCFHFDIDDPNFIIHLIQNSPIYFPSTSQLNHKITPILDNMDITIKANGIYTFEDEVRIQIYLSQLLIVFNSLAELSTNTVDSNKSKYAKLISEKIKSEINEYVLFFTNADQTYNANDFPVPPKVTEIIKSLKISEGYGNRVFKEVYGFSPREYMSKLKIGWAQQMLSKPQFTINEIARALGYQNSTHFSRQFKRWTGETPKNYR